MDARRRLAGGNPTTAADTNDDGSIVRHDSGVHVGMRQGVLGWGVQNSATVRDYKKDMYSRMRPHLCGGKIEANGHLKSRFQILKVLTMHHGTNPSMLNILCTHFRASFLGTHRSIQRYVMK